VIIRFIFMVILRLTADVEATRPKLWPALIRMIMRELQVCRRI